MVRCGLITPVLAFGGAERWMLDLMRWTDPTRVSWQGTALLRKVGGEPVTIAEFEKIAPVFYQSSGCFELAARCDVLIAWGTPNVRAYIPNSFTGRRILVSHGSGPWTSKVFSKPHGMELVAVAQDAVTPIEERWRDRVTLIYNGVDPERCRSRVPRDVMRKRWKVPSDAPVLGFLGRLSGEKSPFAWVRTLAALPGWYGVMAGVGWDQGGIEAEARRCGVTERLRLPGFVADVGSALHAFDVLLMPAHEEGYGLAVVEAMLAKVPVVSTPVGIVKEAPYTVELVPLKADAEVLAPAVLRAQSGAHIEAAYAWAMEHATAERFGRAWTEYLDVR